MTEITMNEFLNKGEELYGKEKHKWEFICPTCKHVQSVKSIQIQLERRIKPLRYPNLEIDDRHDINAHTECYSNDCNWVSYGLFNSGLLVIFDGNKPHDANLNKNCTFVFQFADYEFK